MAAAERTRSAAERPAAIAPERAPGSDLASNPVTERFYAELREIAHRLFASERGDHTLQPTAVVNEACLRLMTSSPAPDLPRAERLALAARVLQQVLIDHARARRTQKRGGSRIRIDLGATEPSAAAPAPFVEPEVLHEALEGLRRRHVRQADVIVLRCFGGLSIRQIAEVLDVSQRSVEADWTVARAWLRRELAEVAGDEQP